MNNAFGYGIEQWNKGKEEMRAILQGAAAARGMMPHSELTTKTRSINIHYHSDAMAAMLGQISREEDAAGNGMLSVIVVHKIGDMEPGKGFYELAAELERDCSNRMKLWVSELHRVHDYWANAK